MNCSLLSEDRNMPPHISILNEFDTSRVSHQVFAQNFLTPEKCDDLESLLERTGSVSLFFIQLKAACVAEAPTLKARLVCSSLLSEGLLSLPRCSFSLHTSVERLACFHFPVITAVVPFSGSFND